ncbi:MAG TPA: hypothetical protein VM533_00675 [Fimbriiglobus sp.]|jgi:hypothetical protein|nr:hypothetical protein [Fimbriiglobus sp.]
MFQMVACNLAVLAIAMIFYAWRDGYLSNSRGRAGLQERVAYMLWVAAHKAT